MRNTTQIVLWKYPVKDFVTQQVKTIKLIYQLDFLHSACIWENKSNSGNLMEFIWLYWLCYWYGSAGSGGLIAHVDGRCVGGSRTQVSSSCASANISLLLQSCLGWCERMDDSSAVETVEWLRYLPHYSYSCLNFRSVSRKYGGESKGFMSYAARLHKPNSLEKRVLISYIRNHKLSSEVCNQKSYISIWTHFSSNNSKTKYSELC